MVGRRVPIQNYKHYVPIIARITIYTYKEKYEINGKIPLKKSLSVCKILLLSLSKKIIIYLYLYMTVPDDNVR